MGIKVHIRIVAKLQKFLKIVRLNKHFLTVHPSSSVQCDGYESLQLIKRACYKIMYSICYIVLENNTLHKFKVNKINRCACPHL